MEVTLHRNKRFFCSLHSLLIPKSFKLQPLHQLHFIYLITESAFLMFSGIFQLHCSALSLSAFTVFFGIFQLFQLIEVLRECKKRFRLHGSHRNTFFREVLYFYPKWICRQELQLYLMRCPWKLITVFKKLWYKSSR